MAVHRDSTGIGTPRVGRPGSPGRSYLEVRALVILLCLFFALQPTASGADPSVAIGAPIIVDAVSSANGKACVRVEDGSVKCWGNGFGGQLGSGNTTNRGNGPGQMGDNAPFVDLGTGRTALEIVAGGNRTCAILDTHALKCWGRNDSGQLGLGDTTDRGDGPGEMGDDLPAVDLGTGRTATAIAAGRLHTCAILDNGTVKCWGYGGVGALGQGDTTGRGDGPGEMGDDLPAVDLGTGRTATAIAAGTFHTCAILDNGTVKCWGSSGYGQLGYADKASRGDGPGEMGDGLPAVALGAGRTATAIAAGSLHTCAVLDDGTVKCWGANSSGQLGQGDSDNRGDGPGEMGDNLAAVDLGAGRTASALSAGDDHVCAILDNGILKCWGSNGFGELGYGDTDNRGDGPGEMGDNLAAVDLGTGRTPSAITAGNSNTCALVDPGAVKCWGVNSVGQLGQGDSDYRGDDPGEMGDALPTVNLGGSPSVTITAPEDEASYGNDDLVAAAFACTDETGVATCVGDVADGDPIDLTVGQHTFSVTATDAAGNQTTLTVDYTVSDATEPTATIATPAEGAAFTRGEVVLADFACADDIAIATCVGDVDDGQPIDTTTLGDHTFTVTATDSAGNQTPVQHHYTVVAPTCDGQAVTIIVALGETPTSGDDVILGTPGNDLIDARGGRDRICAGGGDDDLRGGAGNDRILAGAGNDTVRGGAGKDTLWGGAGKDNLYGGAKSDAAWGGGGNDRLYGQAGNDSLRGEAGADTLEGGAGKDALNGGPQRDICRGGPQRDTHVACETRTGIP